MLFMYKIEYKGGGHDEQKHIDYRCTDGFRTGSAWSRYGAECHKVCRGDRKVRTTTRSEEHTSELQSRGPLVCPLLLEKKKRQNLLRDANQSTVDGGRPYRSWGRTR